MVISFKDEVELHVKLQELIEVLDEVKDEHPEIQRASKLAAEITRLVTGE